MLARKHPDGLTAPPPIAIAHHIIRAFVECARARDVMVRLMSPPAEGSARCPRILCTGIIVLDEVFRVEDVSAAGRQGRGEGLFHRQWRLRGERGRCHRAARRPGDARGPAGRTCRGR